MTHAAPGMTMFRMPIFTWNILVTSIPGAGRFPILAAPCCAGGRSVLGRTSSTRPTAGRSCGSTCSGSSGIPRLHHRAAVLRHHHRGLAGVQPKPIFGYVGLVGARC
jgi:cytochrome c oxidase subunit 1